MSTIKGFVFFDSDYYPVTWDRETNKHVFDVRRVKLKNEKITISKRLYDEKMHKREIYNASFDR